MQAAIARDPKFALAYCLLSEVQWNDPWQEPTPERIAQARANLETALKLAPESGEVHLHLGLFYQNVGNGQLARQSDMKRAEEEFRIAARKLPNSVVALRALADFERSRGEWGEALRRSRRAAELDPRDPDAALELAEVYGALRRYPEADKVLDNAIAILPHDSTAFLWAGKADQAAARGDTQAAMAALDAHPFRNTGVVGVNRRIADVMVLDRRYDEAAALVSSLEQIGRTHNTLPSKDISYERGEWENLSLQSLRAHKGKRRRHAQHSKHRRKISLIGWCKNLRNRRRSAMSRSATRAWGTKKKRCAQAAKLRNSGPGRVIITGPFRSPNRWRSFMPGPEITARPSLNCRTGSASQLPHLWRAEVAPAVG